LQENLAREKVFEFEKVGGENVQILVLNQILSEIRIFYALMKYFYEENKSSKYHSTLSYGKCYQNIFAHKQQKFVVCRALFSLKIEKTKKKLNLHVFEYTKPPHNIINFHKIACILYR
jgi:hypothetical protein